MAQWQDDVVVPATFDILVVDDNPANLLAIEAALAGLGLNLVTAQSGPDALRQLLERDFALILLDIEMPTMNGFETARLVRGRLRTRHVPIIFVTAFTRDDREIMEGYALGAVDFLYKPIVPEVLRAKASVFVELRRRTDEVARQAELLRAAERQEHSRKLAAERQKWEQDALREQMEHERQSATAMAQKAAELARTVAELERVRSELMRYSRQLEEQDRRKDEFLALLGHELRNPLAPIVTSLELMRSRPVADPIAARAQAAMERQVVHLTRLVDDLLDVSRVTTGKIDLRRERIDLGSIVDRALSLSKPILDDRGQALVVEVPDRGIELDADVTRLVQVISNLLINASKYSEAGTQVHLSAERAGDDVVIRIIDQGRGIDGEMLSRIFDSFVQVKNDRGGLGVGLTLARRLVELHGGVISGKSDGLGHGSEFIVKLPIAPAVMGGLDDEAGTGPIRVEVPHSASALHIVLIDDNPDIRETMQQLLECLGHQVAVAADGLSGLELVLRERPQVALVDIGLPGIDGYTVARRLRQQLPSGTLRLVAMTGFGQSSDRDQALAAGFDSHLIKPARTDQIQRALRGE
ncbi:MAG TPA: response regulator [Kofleriaceae bacterium]|nr:response regulator [Kofleriaceae bacterium]